MSTTVVPQGTSGSGSGGTALTIAESRLHGIRVDWKDVATITIQPGRQLADDDTAITVATGFDVTFADIDTGAEASSTGYYVWLTGASSAVLSLSATAPTGVTGAKYLAGWIYNDSGSDIRAFSTEVFGDYIDFSWSNWSVITAESVAGTQPTTYQTVNTSTAGDAPVVCAGIRLNCYTNDVGSADSLILSIDNVVAFAAWGYQPVNVDVYLPSGGPTYYWLRNLAGGASDNTDIRCIGFRIDRSGVTYA